MSGVEEILDAVGWPVVPDRRFGESGWTGTAIGRKKHIQKGVDFPRMAEQETVYFDHNR